ncbi:MAG: MFS transporter [Pseudomonadales bacterium]|nr:MFS transporter [Pseudomonadales bacterium]
MSTSTSPSPLAQITLLLAGSLVVMSGAAISPALPSLEQHFAGEADVQTRVRLLITLPALSIALIAPMAGWVLDRTSRQRVLLFAMVGFVGFGAAGLWLDNLWALMLSRVELGVAVAFLMSASTALIGDLFSAEQRGRFMGWQMSGNAFLGMGFLLAGGALSMLSWRGAFAVYLAALPLVVLVALFVPRHTAGDNDATVNGGPETINGVRIGGLLFLAMAMMLLFYVVPTQTPFLLAQSHAADAATTGMALAMVNLGGFIAGMAFGWLGQRLTLPRILALGFTLSGCGLLLQGSADSLALVMPGIMAMGMGMGMMAPALASALLANAPVAVRGRLSGAFTSALFLGQFLSPLASQPLVERHDYHQAYMLGGSGVLVVTAVLFVMAELRRPRVVAGADGAGL